MKNTENGSHLIDSQSLCKVNRSHCATGAFHAKILYIKKWALATDRLTKDSKLTSCVRWVELALINPKCIISCAFHFIIGISPCIGFFGTVLFPDHESLYRNMQGHSCFSLALVWVSIVITTAKFYAKSINRIANQTHGFTTIPCITIDCR